MPTHQRSLDFLSLSDLSTLSRHDRRTIRKLLAGVEPAKRDRRTVWYAAPIALEALYRGGSPLDPARERARLDAARSALAEQEHAKRCGELVAVDDVLASWAAKVLAMKDRLRSIPAAATVHIPGFTRLMARKLAALIDETLTELADGQGRS